MCVDFEHFPLAPVPGRKCGREWRGNCYLTRLHGSGISRDDEKLPAVCAVFVSENGRRVFCV